VSPRAGPARRGRPEDGSASVLAIVMVGALTAAAMLVGAVGGVVADQRRVESSADLAALAAAGALQAGEDPCAAAATATRRNGGRLTGCVVNGEEVSVRVTRSQVVLAHRLELVGRARGGPVR
jgi:secretion/DNA translocation related TadE-like protein